MILRNVKIVRYCELLICVKPVVNNFVKSIVNP